MTDLILSAIIIPSDAVMISDALRRLVLPISGKF